jgi:hypothetical protein
VFGPDHVGRAHDGDDLLHLEDRASCLFSWERRPSAMARP